jgi:outer membrane protein assembly factor BamB
MASERHNRPRSLPQRHRGPALVVGNWQGDVAVVQAQTGTRLWHQHTGRKLATVAQDGARFYLAPGVPHALLRQAQRLKRDRTRAHLFQRLQEQAAVPTALSGRRLDDGALVWTQSDWNLTGPLRLAVDGNTLLAGLHSPHRRAEAVPSIYALDTVSGQVLWTTPEYARGAFDWVVTAGGGRVFVGLAIPSQQLQVLETRTGRELWRTERGSICCLSLPRGELLAQQSPGGDLASMLTVLRAEDGTQLSQILLNGTLKLFTDEGIAYSAPEVPFVPDQAWVAAVDAMGGGKELWRAEGVIAHSIALDGDQLYYAGVHPDPHLPPSPSALAEVGSLDVDTGRRLWTWHSPRNTPELLQLWGTRTPVMLVDSTKKSWMTIMSALTDPRDRKGRLLTELQIGQWRHPYTLHGAINALWLEARDGLVYVGTRLGLFALDGKDGTVKWHALPDLDLSFVRPALPPR